jgi:hypothetical protein
MQIFHDSGASTLSHEGATFEADEHGRFDLPEAIGREVSRFAGWHVFTGDPEPSAEETAAAEAADQAATEKAELLARVEELEKSLVDVRTELVAAQAEAAAATTEAAKAPAESGEGAATKPAKLTKAVKAAPPAAEATPTA